MNRLVCGIALCLASSSAALAAARLPVDALRVAPPAQYERERVPANLLPRQSLEAGDLIRTGDNGRVMLGFAGVSILTLGGEAELLLHSADPPSQGRGALLRLKLDRGALRVDAKPRPNLPPQDLRLNVGRLKLRVYGGDVWAEAGERGETVCLLSGAVEILGPIGDERLDLPNECLVVSNENRRMLLKPGDALSRKLARTAFGVEQERPRQKGWTLVVASVADEAAAQAKADVLRSRGLPAEVRIFDAEDSRIYRVVLGTFATRELADAYAAQVAESHGVRGAWLTQF